MSECPTPDKLRFRDKRDATERAYDDSMKFDVDMRIYRCPCGRYHLTTHHNRSKRGAIEKRREHRQKREYRKQRIAEEMERRRLLCGVAVVVGIELEARKNG